MDMHYEEFGYCAGNNCLASSCPHCSLFPVANLGSDPGPSSIDDLVFDHDPESYMVFNLDPSFMGDIDFDTDPGLSFLTDLSDSADPSDRSSSIASSYGSACTSVSPPPTAENDGKTVADTPYTESAEQATTELAECNSSHIEPVVSPMETDIDEPDSKHGRDHPMYQATPGKDELYHCPFEGQPKCDHQPTRLKCHYDKQVDSHLRPFKCKDSTCSGARFSSTACLRRHEKEAHGMYGHGSKPHLCVFPGCDRAAAGNGFPRRYNLFGHMKRVHHHTAPPLPSSSPSASAKGARRKRKAPDQSRGRKQVLLES